MHYYMYHHTIKMNVYYYYFYYYALLGHYGAENAIPWHPSPLRGQDVPL